MKQKAIILFMMSLLALALVACSTSEKKNIKQLDTSSTVNKDDETGAVADTQTSAVVQKVDSDKQQILLKEIGSGQSLSLSYSGATSIKNKYGTERTVSQISSGEIVQIVYQESTEKLISIQADSEAWEYTKLKDFSFDRSNKYMMIADEKFQYGNDLSILSNEEEIDFISLSDKDVLTVRGYGKKVYSITVTSGHGYLTLENDEQLIGGWIEVDFDVIKPISEGMQLTVSEGDHKVTVVHNGIGGTKNITISRGETFSLDVSEYKASAIKSGSIKFNITPDTAVLYLNGEETSYDEIVTRNYGSYRMEVKADGYSTYTSTIILGSSYVEIDINLEDSSATTTQADTESSQANTESVSNGIDSIPDYLSNGSSETESLLEDDSTLDLYNLLGALTDSDE